MYRSKLQDLIKWKENSNKKPLVLQGARQVGKTWLIDDFGSQEYDHYFKFNFEEDPEIATYFQSKLDPYSIIQSLALHINQSISPDNTLIFFDEIQACPKALTSLKYFYENAPEYHVIAAGSLLGVSYGKESSFPVGKVNFINVRPLSFYEFLLANEETHLAQILTDGIKEALPTPIHDKLIHLNKLYFFLGGMPEVVDSYIKSKDPILARSIQKDILYAYQKDFSKYSTPLNAIKITELWESIPYQISKENKKFKYSDVKHKARASNYQYAINWLKSAGLIHVVHQLRDAKIPLGGYVDTSKFKVYLLDTGLLGAMLDLTSDIVLSPTRLFKEYNGAFVENYVTNELSKIVESQLYYWKYERGSAEVDFIFQRDNKVVPIEVKSGTNKNTVGLRNFYKKFNPDRIFRASPRNFISKDEFTNLPLYALLGIGSYLPNSNHH